MSSDSKRKAPGDAGGAKKTKKAGGGGGQEAKKPPRSYTVSVAIPGSLAAVASREVRTFICGQVARTCTLFAVDEVVIYDDKNDGGCTRASKLGSWSAGGGQEGGGVCNPKT